MNDLSLRWISFLEHVGVRLPSAAGQAWSRADHTAFAAQTWTRTVAKLRLVFGCVAILFLAFWPWDLRLDPLAAQATLLVRLAIAGLLLAISMLPSFSRLARQVMPALYAFGMCAAAVALMLIGVLLPGGYGLIHGAIMLVIGTVGVLGPYDRFSAPLVLAVTALPNALVVWLMAAGASLPGLPPLERIVSIACFHAGAAMLALLLMRLNTVERQQLFLAERERERLATTDPLTGAKNRRVLRERFAHEAARQRRARGSTALLMLDIDHFKRINDAYGHRVGDEVLRDLVQRWSLILRDIDVLCRVGGEEFVALLPDTIGLDALVIAERLRHETAELPVATSAGPVSVTVSLGVVVAGPDIDNLDLVLERADAALFEAKAAGRDRVMVSSAHALAA